MSLGPLTHLKAAIQWWSTWHALPVWSWLRAAEYYRLGAYARAVDFYERGLKYHPRHAAQYCARLDMAYCLFREGRLKESERQLKLVCNQLPDRPDGFLRLAKLQIFAGRPIEAAWTMHRALKNNAASAEILSVMLFGVLEYQDRSWLKKEALDLLASLDDESREDSLLQAVLARLEIINGNSSARSRLSSLAASERAQVEVLILQAQTLLEEGALLPLNLTLRRALQLEADNPRVLSLLAQSYLSSGEEYNPEFALQHALAACQKSGWQSARELHVLAEAYFHRGDNVSAINAALKGIEAGSQPVGSYARLGDLRELIETIESGAESSKSGQSC